MTILFGTLAALAVLLVAVSAPGVIRQRRIDVAARRAGVLWVVIHVDTEGFRRGVVEAGAALGRFGVSAAEAAKAVDDFTASYRATLRDIQQTTDDALRKAATSRTAAARTAQAQLVTGGHEDLARGLDALIPPKADQ